jgi:hypothetical protein
MRSEAVRELVGTPLAQNEKLAQKFSTNRTIVRWNYRAVGRAMREISA